MRLIAAHCSAIYTGRGDTKLGKALRAIMLKEDGSVSIHNDVGNKPLNYMKNATLTESIEDGTLVWTFDQRKESLRIEIHEIVSDIDVPLVQYDEGLIRDGTEAQLQEWLADNLHVFGEGYELVGREFPTGNGPVDLFVHSKVDNQYYAVEVKRVAILSAVYQVKRYVDALNSPTGEGEDAKDPAFGEVKGIMAALDIRPKAEELATKRGIRTVTLPAYWRDEK